MHGEGFGPLLSSFPGFFTDTSLPENSSKAEHSMGVRGA